MYTVDDVIRRLPATGFIVELPAPPYSGNVNNHTRIGLAVSSMRTHMTDEGWQIFQSLEEGGDYHICCRNYEFGTSENNVPTILSEFQPGVIVVQDKREWEGKTAGSGFDRRERFENVQVLKGRDDIFKLTILKDSQQDRQYHRDSADEIGCHGWIIYYHPRIVKYLAPYVREHHLVRTYHTVDPEIVPSYQFQERKKKALLSGATSGAYPLRQRLYKATCPQWDYRLHPGYGRTKCDTPNYLQALSHYRVAICTASRYGYAVRKIIEATACGCRVITDLPMDEILPHIDSNLTRVHPDSTAGEIQRCVDDLVRTYDPAIQQAFAEAACQWYDYREMGKRLADDIELMRSTYNNLEV